jgi:hypothetical protein
MIVEPGPVLGRTSFMNYKTNASDKGLRHNIKNIIALETSCAAAAMI